MPSHTENLGSAWWLKECPEVAALLTGTLVRAKHVPLGEQVYLSYLNDR